MSLNAYPQIIAYDNVLADTVGTLTATYEDTDNPVENAIDFKTNTKWIFGTTAQNDLKMDLGSGNDQNVNYFACQGHNLDEEAVSITLAYSDDDVTYTDTIATFTPTDNSILFKSFDTESHRYWRVRIVGASADAYITNVFAGVRIDLPTGAVIGFTPPKYNRADNIRYSVTESGQFAGSSRISEEVKTTLTVKYVPIAWIEANYSDLLEHVLIKPIFYQWDNVNHASGHAAYLWLENAAPQIQFSHGHLYQFTMQLKGRIT